MRDFLRFHPQLFTRVWGGHRLGALPGECDVAGDPVGDPVGEAWLVSDHAEHTSVVAEGPLAGATLGAILERNPGALLGSVARRTRHGRFPLLLKLIDASTALSVQVHPDDACAEALGEDDVGKSEMWHVLAADSASRLYCGLTPETTREDFISALATQNLEALLAVLGAVPSDSLLVPAGTIHAIGGGILLAEIQQNSDLTYRVYDWRRVGADGRPREVHVEKALLATHFGTPPAYCATPLALAEPGSGAAVQVLAACRHFAAERIEVAGFCPGDTRGRSFHLLLALDGVLGVEAAGTRASLMPTQAILIPAAVGVYAFEGSGCCLRYYVPDLGNDIVAPLRAVGHPDAAIAALAGRTDDLRSAM